MLSIFVNEIVIYLQKKIHLLLKEILSYIIWYIFSPVPVRLMS